MAVTARKDAMLKALCNFVLSDIDSFLQSTRPRNMRKTRKVVSQKNIDHTDFIKPGCSVSDAEIKVSGNIKSLGLCFQPKVIGLLPQ